MKMLHKSLIFSLICIAILGLASCERGQVAGADTYCDSIVNMQNATVVQMDSFFQSMHYVKYDTPEFYRKALAENNRNMLALKELGTYKGNATLNAASQQVLAVIQQVLDHEALEMVRLDSLLLQEYDKEKVDCLDSLENDAILRITRAVEDFDAVQMNFLNAFGFDVEFEEEEVKKSEIDDEM